MQAMHLVTEFSPMMYAVDRLRDDEKKKWLLNKKKRFMVFEMVCGTETCMQWTRSQGE